MDSLVKREIIESFNDKPRNGINKIKEWCTNNNKDFAEETAKLFYEEKNNLNLESVGDYLGTGDNEKVLEHFVKQFDFKEKDYLESLREFLGSFKLPGEAQKIDRLVESFGSRYYEQNLNGEIKSKDAAYILAFQTIMLNTDLHNPSIAESKKMIFEQLKNNLRDTNENQNFSDDLLSKIYDGIKAKPFKLNFIETAPGYEIAGINSQSDKIFKKLDDFLTTKTGINNVFSNLENNITAEYKQPKTWLNKFTGYEGSLLIKDGNAEVEIQIYKPNILSKWFLGEKNKLVIQPKQQSEQSLKLAAQITASFETEVTSVKATYDYLTEDLINQYESAKKPELAQAASATKLQENIKEITKDLQKHDPQIPDISQKPLASKENFEDLVQADLGKTVSSKSLSFVEEALRGKENDYPESEKPLKSTEEKIDNHTKRLEELKQKQQDLETRKKELEEKKASTNITKEEKWKIVGELDGISNHLKAVERERNTINNAAEREKQFNKAAQSSVTKKESTAAELQQQGAMAAIKRMKEQKKQEGAANKNVLSDNQAASPLKPGVIPPPPPMPGSNSPTTISHSMLGSLNTSPSSPPMPYNEPASKLQTQAKNIGNQDKHKGEITKAIQERRKKIDQGRGI